MPNKDMPSSKFTGELLVTRPPTEDNEDTCSEETYTGDVYDIDGKPFGSPPPANNLISDDSTAQIKRTHGRRTHINTTKDAHLKASQDQLRVSFKEASRKRTYAALSNQNDRQHGYSVRHGCSDMMAPPPHLHTSQRSRNRKMNRSRQADYPSEVDNDEVEVPMMRNKTMPLEVIPSSIDDHHRHSPSHCSSYMSDSEFSGSDVPINHSFVDTHHSLFVTPGPGERSHDRQSSPLPGPSSPKNAAADLDDDPVHRRRVKAMRANPSAHPYVRKKGPEHDPENREIKRLRQHERLHWDEIVARLDKARVDAGKSPSFSVAAVYGRFSRVAPRIAELDGEEGFDYRDYLHFKHKRNELDGITKKQAKMPVMSKDQEEMLVGCYEEVERERWHNVAAKFKLRAGVKLSPEQVAKKWKTL